MSEQDRHQIQLPKEVKPTATTPRTADPTAVAHKWLTAFGDVLRSSDASKKLDTIFLDDGWWRDHLAVTWDLRTLHGIDVIAKFAANVQKVGFSNLQLVESGAYKPAEVTPEPDVRWIQSMFTFETEVGRGKGMLRLVPTTTTKDGNYKALAVSTTLLEIKGHEEFIGDRRPHGGNNSLQGGVIQGNWFERRKHELEFVDHDPEVIILGAGQAGLNIGARLKQLGLSCLLVDKTSEWATTGGVDTGNWPLYTPKDKLADWFEYYAGSMELDIWLQTTIQSASFDDATHTWTVVLSRASDGSTRTMKPKHLIVCTGHSGEPLIPKFPGRDEFHGVVYHGSQHKDASTMGDLKGTKAVIVGSGNSGHDFAQNYYENGADVVMIQRRGTYVITADRGAMILNKGTYDEHSPPTEDADLFAHSLPIPVQFTLNVEVTKRVTEVDGPLLDGLKRAGFCLDFGQDGAGISRKYLTRGGGYSIDVGASQLIADGKIKAVHSPEGIARYDAKGLVLADGRTIPADIVVLATGFDNMRTTARKILGDAIADRCKDVWDLDDEGEINAMWRPSGHPHLWYMGGNLAYCRIYSRHLALQIQAIHLGLNQQ